MNASERLPGVVLGARQLTMAHQLWDELADLDATCVVTARNHLLAGLCQLAGGDNATWVGAVRMGSPHPADPVLGWRPRLIHHLRSTGLLEQAAEEQRRLLESGQVDATTIHNVATAGSYRTHRLIDLVPPEWFEGDYYRAYYLALGHHDAIWAGVPINADSEIYFGSYRGHRQPGFSEAERDAVAYALRGLRWFHRQQMLGHGLLLSAAPLTRTEHAVLQGLLQGLAEKQIAASLGQSPHTTHEYVSRVFRKYAVHNRAALMALWLGRQAAPPDPDPPPPD